MSTIAVEKDDVTLVYPSAAVYESYIAALREGFRRGIGETKTEDEIEEIIADFDAHIAPMNAPPEGTIKTPDGQEFEKVPYETLWLVADDIFIGEISFRHELSDFLEQFGGHVGYGIRPALEGQGLGTLALKLTIDRARELGIEKLLLTCSPDNLASEKVITKNGGEYIDTVEKPFGFDDTKRFWVPTQK